MRQNAPRDAQLAAVLFAVISLEMRRYFYSVLHISFPVVMLAGWDRTYNANDRSVGRSASIAQMLEA
jgi:hypothetical protein